MSLDPDNSLVRSYLGKAYFEEKRDKLSVDEFDMAKSLDPLDPTPFFYDAIRKQTVNRPVEALHDLQKAIELNDNRAVYRSRLLLDEDLAARSASLARIYSDLGFQQLALVEGWKSVNTDPGNFSAHRFLADSYAVLPRHEIARVSELLQSQLLQPINSTPIQPRLAESNLLLISSGGPGGLSFNEFNPLFNRDRVALQTSVITGENGTFGGEAVVSGIYNKVSFSVGYTHFETNGWRINNDQNDDIANIFAQLELSHKTSIQAEYRYRETERGDLLFTFDPEDFFPNERTEDDKDSFRLGFRHAFSPGSVLIGNFQHNNLESKLTDENPAFLFSLDSQTDERGRSGELQYQFRSQHLTIVSGAGHFDIDGETVENVVDFGFPFPEETFPSDTDHTNLYLYSYLFLPKNVILTLGGSGDFFNTESSNTEDIDQFNPKFGITWNPFTATTVRGAVFRTLKRTLITDQTLEPTQVAGFNQFFDDANSTETWRYGVAIDQKFSQDIYGGVEFSTRELEVPFQDFFTGVVKRVEWDENLGRTYLFWTPRDWLSLSAEYLYEKFERDKEFAFNVLEVNTHRVPVGANFFHPSGLSASTKATYFDQQGKFEVMPGSFQYGKDDFWLFDAAISYRLPKRYGFVTIGAKNLFDEEFNYFDTDPKNPAIQPDRTVFASVTVALP
jgi:tetratricopeptide (TPR) repeat protein